MAVTPVSSIAKTCQGAIDLISQSAVFQAHVSTHHAATTNDVAGALLHIHGYEIFELDEDSLEALRPFAVVMDGEGIELYKNYHCDQPGMAMMAAVEVVISDRARATDVHGDAPADDWNDSWMTFLNFSYGTMENCGDLAGGSSGGTVYFPFSTMSVLDVPVRTPRNERLKGDAALDFWSMRFGMMIDTGLNE